MQLRASEFILNADRSIYHLYLHPDDIADIVLLVGDPARVPRVASHFDEITSVRRHREFHTQKGIYRDRDLTVISTGIGTDNIDIVINELDALVNIDFETRQVKNELRSLSFVRIGTSGGIQPDIPLDSMVMSEYAIGFDNLLHFYNSEEIQHPEIQLAFIDHMDWSVYKSIPYVVACDSGLADLLDSPEVIRGFTGTNVGFYGPQGRQIRLVPEDPELQSKMASFAFEGKRITNLEMESSAIYGLSTLLGHKAVSMNTILANRATGEFSKDPAAAIDALIAYTLDKLIPE